MDRDEQTEYAKETFGLLYNTSVMNSSYQVITKQFPELPSAVKSALNMTVVKAFNSDMKEVLRGQRSIRNYKLGMPIPFNISKSMVFTVEGDEGDKVYLEWLQGIRFFLKFGKDKSNNRAIVDQIILCEYKFCDSAILIDDNKLFLLLTTQFPKNLVALDYNKIAATNLGMNCPLYLTTSDGHHKAIGDKTEFLNVRRQFDRRRTQLQMALVSARGGHGRNRKLKALDNLRTTEKNFAKTYNHRISKQLVMHCLKYGIGTIKTEDLLGGSETLEKTFVLRNWSYFQLQQDIRYKAGMYNIKVISIPPQNITLKCNCCKQIDEDAVDYSRRVYSCRNEKCSNFGLEIDCDHNASLNVLEGEEKIAKVEVL